MAGYNTLVDMAGTTILVSYLISNHCNLSKYWAAKVSSAGAGSSAELQNLWGYNLNFDRNLYPQRFCNSYLPSLTCWKCQTYPIGMLVISWLPQHISEHKFKYQRFRSGGFSGVPQFLVCCEERELTYILLFKSFRHQHRANAA